MASDTEVTHATMLNSFAQDVLNSSQNKKSWSCRLLYQLGILVSFDDCYFSKALRTAHFTV